MNISKSMYCGTVCPIILVLMLKFETPHGQNLSISLILVTW